MKLILQNGHVVDPHNKRDGVFDVVIEEGRVKEFLPAGSKHKGDTIIDAKGCIVAPGFIDLHTHLREPGFEYKETIQTGTQSAAAGGFTSICCMANTNPVNDQASITQYILEAARTRGIVNVFPIGALTKNLEGKELAHMGELKEAGCVGFSDDGKAIENNRVMRLAMEYAKTFDLPVMTHSVDPCLSGDGVMNESFTSTKLGLKGIPNQAEDIMVARDIYLAELTGARLHIAHVSTAEGIELVRRAKQRGLKVTCEVCPHHFTLNDTAIGFYDTNAKMAPPLRGELDRLALIEGMASGVVDAIATDHAPHAPVDKELEFNLASCGVVGLETALSLSLKLVHDKKIKMNDLIKMLTINPARIVAIDRGTLSEGAVADITIFNPTEEWVVSPETFHCKSKNSPFGGMKVKGKVKQTIVAGKIVFE